MKTIETHLEPEVYELVQEWLTSHMGSLTVTGMTATASIKLDWPVDSFGLMKAGKAFVFLKKKELLPATCESLGLPLGSKSIWKEVRIPVKINPEALRRITLNGMNPTEEELTKAFTDSGVLLIDGSVEIKATKFIKGQWYTHAEPGQEKFLIRVEDPEKQICSGWDCKGNPFKNEWVHLGNRLTPIPNDLEHIDALNKLLEANFK